MFQTWLALLVLLAGCLAITSGTKAIAGSDLSVYVTRPEIRAPTFDVLYSEPESITPGYWFVAPYADLASIDTKEAFVPFQELIWSGAGLYHNRNVFDFRLQIVNGQPALSFILSKASGANAEDSPAGLILDTSYEVLDKIALETDSYRWDLHEFRIINGNTSISTMEQAVATDISSLNLLAHTGLVWQYGFKETKINTGEIIREWLPLEAGITVTESMIAPPAEWSIEEKEVSTKLWDCFHTNSVDRNADGDYLVSMRYTSTIYKVSGLDGSIIWRLGGKHSDFIQDFNFSSQHHATFSSYNDTVTIISFLDNASDEEDRHPATAVTSSIKVVALHEYATPKKAELLQQFDRPDGRLTRLRGSAQLLPNNGFFAGWSEDGYVSEFTPEGRTVLEARFSGNRFNTYRAYKFEFVGTPKEPPVLKTFAYGDGSDTLSNMSTVFFVSWNGATEVSAWDLYVTNNVSVPFQKVGSAAKFTFETSFMTANFWAYAYAEARDSTGVSLGRSAVATIELQRSIQQKYDQASLTVAAGLLQTAADSRHDGKILVASSFVYITFGICITVFAFLGFVVTMKWLFLRLRRSCNHALAENHSLEQLGEQTEGLLKVFKTKEHSGGGLGHRDQDDEDVVNIP